MREYNTTAMNNLYSSLSAIYEAMYQSFINYEDEYNFYSAILLKHHCNAVLEIGCGTGNLASRFIDGGFTYTGIDLSDDMLNIAEKNNPQYSFIKADMRDFKLKLKVSSAIITGRTISYLITNKDVYDAFISINKNLTTNGIICFDCIDANKFIPLIKDGEKIVHKATVNNKKFHRDSFWKVNFSQSWAFDWLSVYYQEEDNGNLVKIGEDNSTIRAFSKDEIGLLLQLTGFTVKEIIDRPSYAFDTFVVVAKKIKEAV
ncbi:hypothetical protein BH10BAC2_BH10BAC2_04000 [soil metagenome]